MRIPVGLIGVHVRKKVMNRFFTRFGLYFALCCTAVFLAPAAFSQSGCDSFKEGDYAYANPAHAHWEIERVGEYQLEYSEKYDVLFVASLEWTDECSYTLQYVSISNPDYFGSYGKILHCSIEPVDEHSYRVVVDDDEAPTAYLMVESTRAPMDGHRFSPVAD